MPIFARINSELEEKFRIKVIKKYGAQRGAIEKALEEAIRKWLEE